MPGLFAPFRSFPLAFGGASVSGGGGGYGFGDIAEDAAQALLDKSFELGLRVYDTAPIYGFGQSERTLAPFLKRHRDQAFIVTKCGVSWHPSTRRVNFTNDPKVAQGMLEQSLRDLDVEVIDLYMIHWPDAQVDIRRPLEVLAKAQREHKIKHIGLCNTNLEDLERAQELVKVEAVQSEFSFTNRKAQELFPYLKEKGIDFMSWGTLDKGILTGRVTPDRKFDASDCRSWAPWWKSQDLKAKLKIVDVIKHHKGKYALLEMALGHNLSYPEVNLPIVGARTIQQVQDLANAMKNLPSPAFIQETLKAL